MKTIRVKLPEEIARQISALAPDEEAFIVEAVKEKIEREQSKKQLGESCQIPFGEDANGPKGFEPTDFEYWQ
jgi:UDP-N-acetylglucosamine 2-epimerase